MTVLTADVHAFSPQTCTTLAYQRFRRRLLEYGLDENKPHAERLIVAPGLPVCLNAESPHKSSLPHKQMSTIDIDQAKLWVGIEDRFFDKYPRATPHYAFQGGLASQLQRDLAHFRMMKKTNASEYDVLTARNEILSRHKLDLDLLAKAYIYGNSKSLRRYKAEVFDLLTLTFNYALWFIKHVEVLPGGILQIDPNGIILFADTITIYKGGQIKSEGRGVQIKIVCNSLMKIECENDYSL